MKNRIKGIKCYQSVTFEGKQETHFTVVPVPHKPAITIEVLYDLGVVELKSAADHVQIPLTNVAAIYFWCDKDTKREEHNALEAAKPTHTLRPSDLKRPSK